MSTVVFRTTFSRIVAVTSVALAAVIIVTSFIVQKPGVAVVNLILLFPAAVFWVLFWDPRVALSARGVSVHNIVRTIHAPWASITGASVKYGLVLSTTAGDIEAWALPRGSRGRHSLSDDAADAINTELETTREGRATADAPAFSNTTAASPEVTKEWNRLSVALLISTAVIAGAVLAF